MEPIDALRAFRDSLYRCFDRRADALFELGDALLTAGVVPSPVHLSLEPAHRRGWGSLYAALDRGRLDAGALRRLLARHPLAVRGESPVYAVDVSVWPRCDAECSPERGYYYHPSRHSAGQPIVAGWAYQWIARLGFARESWTAPMDVERVRPTQNTNVIAAAQVKALLDRLPTEEAAVPLFVFDAGYDPVQVQQGLEGCRAQILVRLRAGRCFYADPTGPPAPTGRSRRHGRKFDCKDPSTWPRPSAEHACEDAGYGTVRVRAWAGLHPKVQAHAGRGSRGPTPIVVGTLVLVEVERLPRGERRREPRVLCGCGGTVLRRPPRQSWTCSGVLTRGASTWSTPFASSSRLWGGAPLGCGIPSKPIGGRGWCSSLTHSLGWHARVWPTEDSPGRGATPPAT